MYSYKNYIIRPVN